MRENKFKIEERLGFFLQSSRKHKRTIYDTRERPVVSCRLKFEMIWGLQKEKAGFKKRRTKQQKQDYIKTIIVSTREAVANKKERL